MTMINCVIDNLCIYREKLVLKIFVVFSLVLTASTVYADCAGVSCTLVKINRLVVYTNGDVQINTDGDESLLSCDAGTYGYLTLKKDSSNFNAVYSFLLTAKTVDKTINRIRVTGAGLCEIAYVIDE